jgi:hypothetical protein
MLGLGLVKCGPCCIDNFGSRTHKHEELLHNTSHQSTDSTAQQTHHQRFLLHPEDASFIEATRHNLNTLNSPAETLYSRAEQTNVPKSISQARSNMLIPYLHPTITATFADSDVRQLAYLHCIVSDASRSSLHQDPPFAFGESQAPFDQPLQRGFGRTGQSSRILKRDARRQFGDRIGGSDRVLG